MESCRYEKNLAARFAIVEYTNMETSHIGTYDLSQDYLRFMFAEVLAVFSVNGYDPCRP